MAVTPTGFGLIAGRSTENAIAALAAAEKAGLFPSVVLTVDEGYLLPEAAYAQHEATLAEAAEIAVLDKAEEPGDVSDPAIKPPVKKAAAKKAPTTDAPAPE